MGMYNLEFTGTMPPTVLGGTITFYENLNSLVDIPNTKYIIGLCRSRKTNVTRVVTAYPSGGSQDIDNPVYFNNDRFWKFGISFLFASKSIRSGYDNLTYRQQSIVVMPSDDTMDIDLYYGSTNTYVFSHSDPAQEVLTKIEGTNIVVNLKCNEDYIHKGDFPVSFFTEYNKNDVVPIIPDNTQGQPSSSQEELNAQYGPQTYEV